MEAVQEEYVMISNLGHINAIEDPSLVGKPVVVEGVVASTSIAYLVPTEIVAKRFDHRSGEWVEVRREKLEELGLTPLIFVGISDERKAKICGRIFPDLKGVRYTADRFRTIYLVRLRAPIVSLEKKDDKVLDEQGREYKSHDIYFLTDAPMEFQPSSMVRIGGLVVPHPRSQRPTVLAGWFEFPDKVEAFDREKLKALKARLDSFPSVGEKTDWLLEQIERYTRIIKRRNVALADLLCYFTPLRLEFGGDKQRGWGNVLVIGDTTTGKSETGRRLIALLGAGVYVTAETASTVGLTGAAVETEGQGWFVDWGLLPLCNGRLLMIDGAQKLSSGNWACLAEAERLGLVVIVKAAKAEAPARTRQIKIANPVNQAIGRYETRAMGEFKRPVQALPTILDKTSIARLDLAVFARSEDVNPDEVNVLQRESYEAGLPYFSEALKWCWSGRAGLEFTRGATEKILSEASRLYQKFHVEGVPLVSIDMKSKLARLSAALAFLTLSTEDFQSVRVTEEHVEKLIEFVEHEYTEAGLNTLAAKEKHEVLTAEEANGLIDRITLDVFKDLAERDKVIEIIDFVTDKGRVTKDELKGRFGLTEKHELVPLIGNLQLAGLIERGNGFYPTKKANQLLQVILR